MVCRWQSRKLRRSNGELGNWYADVASKTQKLDLVLAVAHSLHDYDTSYAWDDSLDEMNMLFTMYGRMSPEKYVSKCAGEGVFHLREFLLSELHLFEQLFTKYLRQEVRKNTKYANQASELILKLIDLRTEDIKSSRVSVLSFNYTNPFTDKLPVEILLNNIHGTLQQQNIIFGIKEQGESVSDSMVSDSNRIDEFSKIKRKMRQLQYMTDWRIPKNISNIIIYGHSLSPADDAYFHSIFDMVNLYESDVVITLAYSIFQQGMSLDPFQDSLFRILDDYGKTMDNKQNGRNILYKMMLESRIKFIEI